MGHNSQRYAVGSIESRQRNRANSGLGLVAQVVSVRAFIAAQGCTLEAEFSDIGALGALRLGAVLLRPGSIASPTGRTRCRGFLEDGYSIQAADMPGANDLMMRIYATMAQT